MEKIGIVTEETADFPLEIIEKYQIAIVPVKLFWPEIENLPGDNTFQKMRELEKRGIKSFGKTSQPSAGDYLEKYKIQLEKFEKIICISLTSKLSGSYNSALQAKKILEPENQKRIENIDSLTVTGGQALLALRAIDLIESGKNFEETIGELEKFVPKVRCYVILGDPKWIEATGRISHLVANLVRGMMKVGIRPVLTLKNGILTPSGLKTNARDIPTALFSQLDKDIRSLVKEGKKIRVVITHGDDLSGAQRLKEMIEKEFKSAEVVFINIINNIVGVPAGPDTITLCWCEA
jgi:DegV family protein with EDD domain